jgi:uncharacterized membrane protein
MRWNLVLVPWVALGLLGCATAAAPTAESKDRAECKEYGRRFAQDPGRMKDACLINRGYRQIYSTILAQLWVRSTAEPRQPTEVIASDLKTCADATKRWSNEGWKQFETCMVPRGYAVSLH